MLTCPGEVCALLSASSNGRGKESNRPKPPRTEVFPSLKGSQAKPTRGSKFLVVGLLSKFLFVQVGQLELTGLVHICGRFAILPYFSVGIVSISYRNPTFRGTVRRTF